MNYPIYTAEEIGKIIRDLRKKQGLTQEDLAGMTRTGRRFISDLENGKETAQIGKILLVFGALGISLHAITQWR